MQSVRIWAVALLLFASSSHVGSGLPQDNLRSVRRDHSTRAAQTEITETARDVPQIQDSDAASRRTEEGNGEGTQLETQVNEDVEGDEEKILGKGESIPEGMPVETNGEGGEGETKGVEDIIDDAKNAINKTKEIISDGQEGIEKLKNFTDDLDEVHTTPPNEWTREQKIGVGVGVAIACLCIICVLFKFCPCLKCFC